jgi:hypothetical protein
MRAPILSLFLIAAALLGEIQSASAQSPYSYPWCVKGYWDGALRCRYTSWDECHARTGRGTCLRNPGYRFAPLDVPVPSRRRRSA